MQKKRIKFTKFYLIFFRERLGKTKIILQDRNAKVKKILKRDTMQFVNLQWKKNQPNRSNKMLHTLLKCINKYTAMPFHYPYYHILYATSDVPLQTLMCHCSFRLVGCVFSVYRDRHFLSNFKQDLNTSIFLNQYFFLILNKFSTIFNYFLHFPSKTNFFFQEM